ncbi:hypothetical protein F0Q45_20860 [Mycobacterium simiae]|uniref:ATP-grasp domain-containing protein n=1 Tax=Mycobacterium simiae TaxID=1784 RepID=A0A5B1BI94_MYCSI|nr:hypothetical protein [Mycobacterium simiae]KAA1248377.1 hypothetical protein F0Q45_20860 [Mycobacterium simiae]
MNRTIALTSLLASADYVRTVFARREITLLEIVDGDLDFAPGDVDPRGILRKTADTRVEAFRYRADDLRPTAQALAAAGPAFVFYGYEHDLASADGLAQLVCPDFANDPATSAARERKDETDRLLCERGYPVPREVSFRLHEPFDEHQLDSFGDSVIIKPVRYAGTHAIVSKDSVLAWLQTARRAEPDREASYTAQELLIDWDADGMQQTYSIDGFAIGGEYHVVSLQRWRKFVFNDGFRYCWADQLDVAAPEHAALLAHTKEVLQVLGLKNGFFHPEFTESPEGLVLIDLNPRVAGADGVVDKMIAAAQGVGVIDTFVDTAFGAPKLTPGPRHHVRLLAIYGLADGEPETIAGLPSFQELVSSKILHCHFVLFAHHDAEQVTADAELCYQRFIASRYAHKARLAPR